MKTVTRITIRAVIFTMIIMIASMSGILLNKSTIVYSTVTPNSDRNYIGSIVGVNLKDKSYYSNENNTIENIENKIGTDNNDLSYVTIINAGKTELNLQVTNMLDEAKTRRELIKLEEARKREIESYEVSISPKKISGEVHSHSILTKRRTITAKEMNKIIDHFLDGRESLLKNTGKYFIKASNETGYDPIFLMALAATESGWTVSHLHKGKSNPYSINMTDENPNGGYKLGNNYNEGIINGAIWIKDNYFNQGYKTLYGMNYSGKTYCSTPSTWIRQILDIMNDSYKVLNK